MPKVKGKLSFTKAAYEVLKAAKNPLSPNEIVNLALSKTIVSHSAKGFTGESVSSASPLGTITKHRLGVSTLWGCFGWLFSRG